MVRIVLASVVTQSIDLSLFLGFFPPSALVLSIAWPHSHHYEQTFPTWRGMADMEMPNPPSGQDLMPAVRTAVSQQPPGVKCLSHPTQGHTFLTVAFIWWLIEAGQPLGPHAGYQWAFFTLELPARLAEALPNLHYNLLCIFSIPFAGVDP